jgi:hypothetical protein
MPTFSFLNAPTNLTIHLRRFQNAPLPNINIATASVVRFMPDYYPRLTARLVSCYALFK